MRISYNNYSIAITPKLAAMKAKDFSVLTELTPVFTPELCAFMTASEHNYVGYFSGTGLSGEEMSSARKALEVAGRFDTDEKLTVLYEALDSAKAFFRNI